MRICLINPLCQPSLWENEIVSHWPPLRLAYIASILERYGHEVKILERRRIIDQKRRTEENLMELDRATAKYIKSFKPDVVGITATTPLIMDAYRTAKIVKEIDPYIRVMIGGCHPTAEPERTLRECSEIDALSIGEGEMTFLDFVNGKPLKEIEGVAYKENGQMVFTKARTFYPEIDDLPFPARNLLDRDFYFSSQSMTIRGFYLNQTTILAARGCPYKCTFCQSGQLAKAGIGKYVRFHSPERVIAEIEHLVKDFKINGLLFAEDMFSIKAENVYNICELMLKVGLNKEIKWAANLRVDSADKELFQTMKDAGCVAFSDDGRPVMSSLIMRRALEYSKAFNVPVISHCEDMNLSEGGVVNEGRLSAQMGLKGIPSASEDVMVARDIILAELTGGRLHIAHVSTEGSVRLIRQAKERGVNVTAETCPHYFTITEDSVKGYDTNAKVNPPLRTQKDVEAIIKGLKDGTIDAIATDHAPHHRDEKLQEFDKAPSGISGFETALSLSLRLVYEGILTMSQLVEKMALVPARILGIDAGTIKVGFDADIAIVDMNKEFKVKSEKFLSKGKNTPFEGWTLKGMPVITICKGKVYDWRIDE